MHERGETGSKLYVEEIERAVVLYGRTVRERRGRVVFVAGSAGSGRTAFLKELAAAFDREKPRPLVLGGSLTSGSYVAWPTSEQTSASAPALDIVKNGLALAAAVEPIAGIALQVVSMSAAAASLVQRLGTRGAQGLDRLVPRLLRAAAEEGPVVVLVDDSHRGDGNLWFDLVSTFGSELVTEVPVLLFLTLEGPTRLPPQAAETDADSLLVACELRGRGVAEWWPLSPLVRNEIRDWIGPEPSDRVVDAIHSVTGGLRSWTEAVWRDWVDRGVVYRGEESGRWQFAPGYRERVTQPVSDLLGDRLRGLSGATQAHELFPLYDLLAYAALEGRTFTAEALAQALDRDRDETIDLLDVLDSDADQPPGILKDAGGLTISDSGGRRDIWLYEFRSWLDWLTLERQGLAPQGEPRARAAGQLAKALLSVYGMESWRIARTLARLLSLTGDSSAARRYQRMADYATGAAALRWQAQQILAADRVQWSPLQCRRKAYVLLEAARALRLSGPFDEGVDVARAAVELAERAGIGGTPVADALTYEGHFHSVLGNVGSAESALRSALEIFRNVRERRGEAAVMQSLAWLDIRRANYAQAREELTRVLELVRALRDWAGVARARRSLAVIDVKQGNYEQAREELTEAIKLLRRVGDLVATIEALGDLAGIETAQDNYVPARELLTEALEGAQALGDRLGEGVLRHQLAEIDIRQCNYDRARKELNAILRFSSQLGDLRVEAACRDHLARIDLAQGNYVRAREHLQAALEVCRRLGERAEEVPTRVLLARCDLEQGNYGDARHQLKETQALATALGHRVSEAGISIDLARIDIEEGDYERAREALKEATGTLRACGERGEEAVARRYLARIDIEEGNSERARKALTDVIDTQHALGHRLGEAIARRYLARIDIEQGHHGRARGALMEVIETLQALGASPEEAAARRDLAEIDYGRPT